MFSSFEIIMFIASGFIVVYALTDRICRCIEHKATGKTFDKFMEQGIQIIDAKRINEDE